MTAQNLPFRHQGPYESQHPQGQKPPSPIPGQMANQQSSNSYGSTPAGSSQSQPPPHPPAEQQYPEQQQVPGYENNNQPIQCDQHYAHQPVQQSRNRHRLNGAAARTYVAYLHIPMTYPRRGQQSPQQWQRRRRLSRDNIQPTPASLGYNAAQMLMVQHIDTSYDAGAVLCAMLESNCYTKGLIRIFSDPKYRHPYAFQQLRNDYERMFNCNLIQDIKNKTQGDFQDALVALIRGPLDHDVSILHKALNGDFIDEEALMDVLLCRSNADIRAITDRYKYTKGKDLATNIKDTDAALFPFYHMVLSAERAEDAAPVDPEDVNQKVDILHHSIGKHNHSVAEIFTSANNAQLRAISIAYKEKYGRSLYEVIEAEVSCDMEDAFLRMLTAVTGDSWKPDADALRELLLETRALYKRTVTNQVLRLYWGDGARFYATQAAYQILNKKPLAKELEDSLSGDYAKLMSALMGGYMQQLSSWLSLCPF